MIKLILKSLFGSDDLTVVGQTNSEDLTIGKAKELASKATGETAYTVIKDDKTNSVTVKTETHNVDFVDRDVVFSKGQLPQ